MGRDGCCRPQRLISLAAQEAIRRARSAATESGVNRLAAGPRTKSCVALNCSTAATTTSFPDHREEEH